MSDRLYVEIGQITRRIDQDNIFATVPLETIIILSVYKYCENNSIEVNFIATEQQYDINVHLKVPIAREKQIVLDGNEIPWDANSSSLPALRVGDFLCAGCAAVARCLARYTPSTEQPYTLLGFRESCLQAPNETSIWTKFCEIEIVNTTKDVMHTFAVSNRMDKTLSIPKDLVRFEYHLRQPIRVHNVYKLTRDMAKVSLNNENKEQSLKCDTEQKSPRTVVKHRKWKSNNKSDTASVQDLCAYHTFAEGPYLTLADMLLYPCYFFLFHCFQIGTLEPIIPNTKRWFDKLTNLKEFANINSFLQNVFNSSFASNIKLSTVIDDHSIKVDNVSLYKCDPKRTNKKKKMFTKEDDITVSMNQVKASSQLEITNIAIDNKIDWKSLPSDASPLGGHLPDERMDRKIQQLDNLARVVVSLAKEGDKIVDFCSGGGHLGILLAYMLPKCTIILLENKENSLKRAQLRVKKLNLTNVYFFQCNLDFFKGSFDIGVALHACGVSTDLVLEKCIDKKASFVVCPCCYGSLHETNRLKYPRSKEMSYVPVKHYMCIGHTADQSHADHPMEERGYKCMKIIDSDRAMYAFDHGYSVKLTRLKPLSCTPKNMMIIGIPDNINP